jgi:hypothetical protein
MKVLIWATTFGADLASLARYLAKRSDVELKVVLKGKEAALTEPVAQLFPIQAEFVERGLAVQALGIQGFKPDVTVFDNEVPAPGKSPAGFALWHGFGWKGPNDRKEMLPLHLQIRLAWGDPRQSNRKFVWQCFGPWDFEHRTDVSGIHPDNCRVLGAASHDELRVPFDRARLQPHYPFDLEKRKTVLIAPTWHYGELFAHWGGDALVLEALLGKLAKRNCNVILRLHDSFRFEPNYLDYLHGLARRFPHLLLKFKDHHPDNFLDLALADVLLTNYSSIANLFYATRRPTVHIYPVRSADEAFMWRRRTFFGVFQQRIEKARYVWKLPPEDHGGLLARSADELARYVDQALDDPGCCHASASAFLDRHMLGADGSCRDRIFHELGELVARSRD